MDTSPVPPLKNTCIPVEGLFYYDPLLTAVVMLRVLRIYVNSALAYGFTRAVTYDYKSSKRYYNDKTGESEDKEMLLVDKIGRISGMTAAAILLWPGMIGEDLARLECAVKGKDPKEYQ
jgi:hypothetical protein